MGNQRKNPHLRDLRCPNCGRFLLAYKPADGLHLHIPCRCKTIVMLRGETINLFHKWVDVDAALGI